MSTRSMKPSPPHAADGDGASARAAGRPSDNKDASIIATAFCYCLGPVSILRNNLLDETL
jgi:hypothetical protein